MHFQDCFTRSLHKWEVQPVPDMKKWLNTYTSHIRQCMKQEKPGLTQKIKDIRSWIKPKINSLKATPAPTVVNKQTASRNLQQTLRQFFKSNPSTTLPQNNKRNKGNPSILNRLKHNNSHSHIQTKLCLRKNKTQHNRKNKIGV